MRIEKLKDGSHKIAGKFDRASRWYPNEEYELPGTFGVRSPSRSWPFSYLKHFYTIKYSRTLATEKPSLYCDLQGITDEDQRQAIFLEAAKARLS